MTPQQPLGSGFGAASTAAEVIDGIDLTGKVAIVTGGYSGLGVETVRAFRNAGASVVVPTRDRAKAAQTLADIDGVEVEPMDLLDPASIDTFAHGFVASGRPLHLLVNSAGLAGIPLTRDARGYEVTFATNHLGHFQLIVGLWPALVRAQDARVVNVSAAAHRFSDIVWDDVNFEHREYSPVAAYAQSKTGNNLYAVGVEQHGGAEGIHGFAAHPGSIITALSRRSSVEALRERGFVDENGEPIIDPSRNMKTPQQGAATSVWCAVSPLLDGTGGLYAENCDLAPLADEHAPLPDGSAPAKGGPVYSGVMPFAVDPESAARLWDLSTQLTGAGLQHA